MRVYTFLNLSSFDSIKLTKSKMGYSSTYSKCIPSVLECGMLCGHILAFDFQKRGESCFI